MIKHSYFIFHQGSMNGLSGEYKQIVASIEDYQEQVKELSSLIKERTLYTDDEIAKNIINEWYIRQEEALEKGVVQAIINDMEGIIN
jgi:ATP-dependent protease ClpP protease subunit